MSCGLSDVACLVDALDSRSWTNLTEALQEYSDTRVPEAHAISELNYAMVFRASWLYALSQWVRSKVFRQQVLMALLMDPAVPYSLLLKRYVAFILRLVDNLQCNSNKCFSL
jgi:2-polyprenyl-6-methoxyphenol hydroxylase-like FAD-dependent oxidoreductase